MADSSPESAGENMEGEYSSPEEQTTQIVNQKIMGQIQPLIEQNKYAALLQVIDLSIQHINQRKEINNLQQYIKQVLEDRVQIKSDLIVQHNFKTNVQSIENVKHATSIRLREKLEAINAHMKSNDAMRLHLKEDDAVARSEMEEIKKLLEALTDKANVLQRTHKAGESRLKDLNQQLHIASVEKEKLQHDCHAIECEMHNVASDHTQCMQQIKNTLTEKESNIKQHVEELKREQQSLAKQASLFEQLQSEINAMRINNEQLKQTVECELSKEAEHFRKQNAFLEQTFDEMKMKNEKLIEDMTETIAGLGKQNQEAEKRINVLKNTQYDLTIKLEKMNDQNSKLKKELDNYNRNRDREMEFARLKESIKASKASAKESVVKKINPLWSTRPKRLLFTKAANNNNNQANASININSESDQSCAFETSAYFEGKL